MMRAEKLNKGGSDGNHRLCIAEVGGSNPPISTKGINRQNSYRLSLFSIWHRRQLFVAIVDVDDLKAVNDRYGHPASDALLQEIASRLRTSLRSSDVIARTGGDECAILLDGIGSETARIAVERCLAAVKRLPPVEHEMKATVSIASYLAQVLSEEELLQRANALCYEAKRAGGDRIQTADASDHGPGNQLLCKIRIRP